MKGRTVKSQPRPPLVADPVILIVTLLLVSVGFLMVYSTTGNLPSARRDKFGSVGSHAAYVSAGLVAGAAASRVPIGLLRKAAPFAYFAVLVLLVAPLNPLIGEKINGASRWVRVGTQTVQPSEFAKPLYVLFLAGYFARRAGSVDTFADGVAKPAAFLLGACLLLFLQRDFGSIVIFTLVTGALVFTAGARLLHVAVAVPLGLAGLASAVLLTGYRRGRILSFLDPSADPTGSRFQINQSLIGIGTGGLLGRGIGASKQKLAFLFAPSTDFVYAVIGEEFGFVGCVAVLAAFLVILGRGVTLSVRAAPDVFVSAAAVGLTLVVVLPALLNAAVATEVVPAKGMALPLISYGGSSVVSTLVTIGLLLSVARHVRKG